MTPAISIHGLEKTYADGKRGEIKHALKGVDLIVERGAFFGLLGPNGAGKSTMINIMAGLVIKGAGRVEICGYDIEKQMRDARRAIGVVPQELVLDTFFTVREALEIHAGYYGVPKAKRRTSEIIDVLGLSDKADVHSRRLSGGMRRRLLVAKALVHSPQVLILDEPTAGVDVELRTQLWDYVKKLNHEGTTVLLTTHYLEEAEELCDNIAIINHGKVIANDTKSKLMQHVDVKQLVLRLSETLMDLPQSITEIGGKLNVQGEIIFDYRPSEANIDMYLSKVHEAGYTIRDVATHEADLEEVFKLLTSNKYSHAS